jgi:hypothetical protein
VISWLRRAVAKLREKTGHEKKCLVYLPFTRDDALVVPYNQDGDDGYYYEMGEDFEQCSISDPIRLGEVVKKQFRRSERKRMLTGTERVPNHRLKASKLRSDKQFEKEYAGYEVRGANSANITMIFESPKILLKPLYIGAACNASDEVAIGNTMLELHDFYRRSIHRPREIA